MAHGRRLFLVELGGRYSEPVIPLQDETRRRARVDGQRMGWRRRSRRVDNQRVVQLGIMRTKSSNLRNRESREGRGRTMGAVHAKNGL